LTNPVGRQRVPLEPQQAHAPGLLPVQNGLDDDRLQQRQTQQFVDCRVLQAFPLCDLAAAADYAIVELTREHGRVTIGEAIKLTGASRNTLKQHFRVLVRARHA
jgi:hypothetical protein